MPFSCISPPTTCGTQFTGPTMATPPSVSPSIVFVPVAKKSADTASMVIGVPKSKSPIAMAPAAVTSIVPSGPISER